MKPTKKPVSMKAKSAKAKSAKSAIAKPVLVKPVLAKPVIIANPAIAKPREVPRPDRSIQALDRLGISEEALAVAPPITPTLLLARGGMKAVLRAMRLSDDDVIAAFLSKYDSIPVADRERVSFEAVALAAHIDSRTLLGAIHLAVQQQAAGESKMIVASHHPDVAASRVKFAKLAGGERDRTALDQIVGFLPMPKGPNFIGSINQTANIFGSGRSVMDAQRSLPGGSRNEENEDTGDDPEDVDLEKLFPPANAMQERLQSIRQRTLQPVDEMTEERLDAIKKACDWHKRGL